MFDASKMHVCSFLRQFTHYKSSTPRKCVCLFHLSDSLHTTNVRPLENACVSFISQTVYQYKCSTPRKFVCLFHLADSLHNVNVRPLENACVCFISQTVYTLQMFDPSKMHVSVSFLRQFTHFELSTPQKWMCLFHFSDSLHTTNVRPLENACVCFISQTVYTLQMFDPSKMHVSVSFLRQFTHCDVWPPENACVCCISQTVYTLQTFDPLKMHVSVSLLTQFTHCER